MAAVADRAISSHNRSEMYDSDASQQMPTSYNRSKPHDQSSLPQERLVSNEHSTFPEIPVSHGATCFNLYH